MDQTDNLGLYLWDGDDAVSVSQINANFETLDGARTILLKTQQITTTTTTVTLDLSDIDWGKYSEVVIRCYLYGDETLNVKTINSSGSVSSSDRCIRVARSTTDTDAISYVYLTEYDEDCTWIHLLPGYNPGRRLCQRTTGNYFSWGYNMTLRFDQLTALRFTNSEATINTGSYLEVWGVL